ncbi:hypothetical protein EMCRGX_G000442 [Ephydatia muelleri]
MLKELALLVTLLTLLADARPQRFEKPLNDLDKMSEEVDINGPLTFDDDIRENSESLTFQFVSINDVAVSMACNHAYLFMDASMNTVVCWFALRKWYVASDIVLMGTRMNAYLGRFTLEHVLLTFPELFLLLVWCYVQHPILWHTKGTLSSETEDNKGNPLSPLLISLPSQL